MMANGTNAASIVKTLGIRPSTLERWMVSPIFNKTLTKARYVVEQEVALTMLGLCHEYLTATKKMIHLESRLYCMDDTTMQHALNFIKAFGKEQLFEVTDAKKRPQTSPESAPNKHKQVANQSKQGEKLTKTP